MGMEQVALGWLVLQMTDSPFMVGVASAARMAPFFFLGILSGAVADRIDRRIFLRMLTFGGCIVSGAMAFLLVSGVAQVWHVILLAGITVFVMDINTINTLLLRMEDFITQN